MTARRLALPAALGAMCLAAVLPAGAQSLYKIIAADGSVTYTDRPPAGGAARVEALGRGGDTTPPAAALPRELRDAAARFPVVLYTLPACAPCDLGRDLLRRRGIPHEERQADPNQDRDAWLRAVGSLDAPALAVGGQVLRGFSADEWRATLDLAGYPRESRLPANVAPTVTPLVARSVLPPPAPADETPAAPLPQPALPLPSGGGIRF